LYKEIGNSIRQYRDSYKSGGQEKKLSIQQDKLMKVLLESPLIEEMVLMNPASEARNRIKSTYKGASGTNIKHAQGSQEIREYHQSMVGLLSPTSDDSSNVGVTRYLSVNPKIVSKRGFVVKTDLNELNASNLLSVVDILSPYSSQHADPPRFSMVGSQTRHTIPTLKMDPQLVITGAEKAIKYNVGTDYVFKAYLDGVVEEIDDKNQLVIIKYKDGTKAAIDLSVKTGRVSDGYFVTIQLSHNLKVGQKFKTDDILALDPQFFTTDSSDFNESSLKLGRLTRLIIAPQDITYEDSSIISKSLADDLASKVTFEKKIALSANINLINMKNIGDTVTTSENLVVYEELIDDESGTLSKIFDKMSADVKNVIEEYNYSKVPSKYTGTIIDMRIYYNRDLSELSDSLRDMITKYQKKYLSKTNKLKEMRTDHVVFIPQIEKIESGKRVAGTEFDGVLVHYFIQTTDSFKVGDKITFDKALKSIVGAIYPDGMEPVTAGGDKIDACISPFSLASRMVMDVFMQGYSNKALLGLKEKIDEMLEEE
jgi:DNA-directed RNA polymerase beta subunit